MPEIKNNFHKGIMNKDLDERVIPNGQYRDAMNIQVNTSETSEVGTAQNILGSERVERIVGSGFKCIGAVADEKNDVLYWFITSDDTDAIIEYHDDGTVQPILVDKNAGQSNAVLKFDRDNIITGINIIDDLLFWTDGVNEPRRINITELKKNGASTLNNHSLMFIDNLPYPLAPITEDHITVIRKRPQRAPTVTFSETSIQDVYYLYEPGDPTTGFSFYGLGEGDTGNIHLHTLNTTSPYSNGDILLLLQNNALGNLPQTYEVKIKVTANPTPVYLPFVNILVGWNIPFEIMEIGSQFNINELLHFDVVKEVDIEPIFEKELIRFATRYKYTDGEYSAFSPFTQPVFFAGAFGFHPTKDPYNLAMENRAVSIKLQDLIPTDIPDDVVQLDILFKKERSTTIYSIDSIKETDPAPNYWNKNNYATKTILKPDFPIGGFFGNLANHTTVYPYEYKGEYEITVENIYAALPANQMLRPWDNVPRKALAQEITANRVIYGNYLQNYTLKDINGDPTKPSISPTKEERDILDVQPSFTNSIGKRSVKSLRTYRLGVVYGDEYGRETPVFTSKDASINIPFDMDLSPIFNGAADKSLRLTATLKGNQPEWAYYFKYYIKQTTGEYYNLTMDRVYRASGDSNLWISFPSSDRNKVQEGDYFSIKKQVDLEQMIPVENKIKIIDIKNEAPETIKYEYISLGTGGGAASDLSAMFPSISNHPAEGVRRLILDKEAWTDAEGGLALEDLSKSDRLAVQFTIVVGGNTINSEKYFVSGFSWEDDGSAEGSYNIVLRKTIQPHDSWVESSVGVLNSDEALTMTVYKLEQKDATEFEGRFFVKIISNPVTQTYLVPSAQDIYNYVSLAKMKVFNLVDVGGVAGVSNGIFNTQNTLTQNAFGAIGNSNIRQENIWDQYTNWDTQEGSTQGWFIDSTMFVAMQDKNNLNARESGRGVKGNLYNNVDNYINGLEGVVSPPNNSAGGIVAAGDDISWPSPYWTSGGGNPGGPRHFSDEPIHLSSGTYSQYDNNPQANNYLGGNSFDDSPYRLVAGGGHFIHLSFFAPGVDLHSGNFNELENIIEDDWTYWSSNVENHYRDVFKLALQKIRASSIYIDGAAGNGNGWGSGHLEASLAQGHWNFPTVPSNGYNVNNWDAQELEEHENQWNPGYLNSGAQAVIDQLKHGSRFKIVDDDLNQTYTIKRVTPIRLYNHTAWNPSPSWRSLGTALNNWDIDNSVAVRLQKFFYAIRNHATINNVSAIIGWQELKDAIHNFGKANNRRVCYVIQVDKDPSSILNSSFNGSPFPTANANDEQIIRFIDNYIEPGANTMPVSPAIFETEAKEDVDLNIYYEASDALPIELDSNTDSLKGHLLGPVGSKVTCSLNTSSPNYTFANITDPTADFFVRVAGWEGDVVELNNPGLVDQTLLTPPGSNNNYIGKTLTFWREDSGYTTGRIQSVEQITDNHVVKFKLDPISYNKKVGLSYYNCFSFGNGVESNRIRDDFNESYILNGVKASTVLEEPYEEERRKYGLIYSGLYNSTSGVNNLNQFIAAEKITKDIMPSYGSIQKLYARDKDLITLCEDKIVQIFVDKDILYNADGNAQLLSTNKVLGEAQPFRGNYGISKNPESFASESFRAYFTDKQRGAVLRLSMDGLTPISDIGMHDYFRDNLRDSDFLYGSYDAHKGDYNLTIFQELRTRGNGGGKPPGGGGGGGGTESSSSRLASPTTTSVSGITPSGTAAGPQVPGCKDPLATNYNPSATYDDGSCVFKTKGDTVSFNEKSKGWTSFKSFIPEFGLSSVNQYYTMNLGELWKHHVPGTDRNTFYGEFTESSITPVLNLKPSIIKNFNTLNYEGSQSKIDSFATITDANGVDWTDNEYYNLYEDTPGLGYIAGWYVEDIHTDKQEGSLNEFIEKEGKWFNYIKGKNRQAVDTAAFNFQGLGIIDRVIKI